MSVREASIEAESAYSGVNLDTEAANLFSSSRLIRLLAFFQRHVNCLKLSFKLYEAR